MALSCHYSCFMALALVAGFLFATALLSLNLSIFLAARKEGSRSAQSMAFLMGATGGWAVLNAFEYMVPSLGAKLMFADLQYAFIAAIPVFWFSFGRALFREERGMVVRRLRPAI